MSTVRRCRDNETGRRQFIIAEGGRAPGGGRCRQRKFQVIAADGAYGAVCGNAVARIGKIAVVMPLYVMVGVKGGKGQANPEEKNHQGSEGDMYFTVIHG